MDTARPGWLGPPVQTFGDETFNQACADLMRLVERDYAPSLVVGVRTGGLVVARAMVRAASVGVPMLPLTCRRASTGTKDRVPLLRRVLAALPQPLVDLLRRLEHRFLTTARTQQVPPQQVDRAEAMAIAEHLAQAGMPARILVADDAVDSGVTLGTVLELLREVCPAGTEIRTAAITQTLDHPVVRPDYVLLRGTLCRFPWSFDARQ